MSTLFGVLEQTRRTYVSHFELMLHSFAGHATHVIPEAALRDRSGAPIREGALGTWLRKDVLIPVAGGAAEGLTIASPNLFRFEGVPSMELMPGFELGLFPFPWDACQVKVRGRRQFDFAPLKHWFEQLSTADDEPIATRDAKPRGLVHFVSDPVPTPAGWEFEVDFGTAPHEAAVVLLEALQDGGATSVLFVSEQEWKSWS